MKLFKYSGQKVYDFSRIGAGIGVTPLVNAGAFPCSQAGGSAWLLSCVCDIANCLRWEFHTQDLF